MNYHRYRHTSKPPRIVKRPSRRLAGDAASCGCAKGYGGHDARCTGCRHQALCGRRLCPQRFRRDAPTVADYRFIPRLATIQAIARVGQKRLAHA
jgi:hypothetical protein